MGATQLNNTLGPVQNLGSGTGTPASGGTQIPQTPVGTGSPTAPAGAAGTGNPFIPLTPLASGGTPTVPTASGQPTFAPPSLSSGVGSAALSGMQETYGAGIGGALGTTLSNLGTATNQAVQDTNAAAMITGQQGFNNLRAQEGAAGVSPNSSAAALEGSDYWNQFQTNLTSTDSQMELSETNTLISSLMGVGSQHGADTSGMDILGDVMQGVEGAAGAAGSMMTGMGAMGATL